MIPSPETLQFPPFSLSSVSKKLFFRFAASKGLIFFLKTAYLSPKHVHNMAATRRERNLKGDENMAFLTFTSNLQCQIRPFEVDTS